jgi:hypothetical protein
MLWTIDELVRAGEGHVAKILRSHGWTVLLEDPRPSGATDLLVTLNERRVLIQVKSAIFPTTPPMLTDAEKFSLISRAKRSEAEAWLVHIQMDEDSLLAQGALSWHKVS